MSKQFLDRDGLEVLSQKVEKKFRFSEMPLATSMYDGKIAEYIGESDAEYTKGYFYECIEVGGGYTWRQINTQPNDAIEHWIGTQAEYEAQKTTIPNGSIVALTDEEDTTYDSGIYSTDEVITGQRWIDGKPIYRRVVGTFTKTTGAGTGELGVVPSDDILVPNVDTVVTTNVTAFEHNNGNESGNYVLVDNSAAYSAGFVWQNSTNKLRGSFGASFETGANFKGIFEYTKTTD